MRTKKIPRRQFLKISTATVAIFAFAAYIGPKLAIAQAGPAQLWDAFQGVKIDESITVDRPVADAFAVVTALKYVGNISDNLTAIEHITGDALVEGSRYKRNLIIHGQSNPQIVTVDTYMENALFVTRTALYDFDVTYTYRFASLDESTTKIDLTKEANVPGVWKVLRPLLHHLLTRPEHDGGHLVRLKAVIES